MPKGHHLARLNAPKIWAIKRKSTVWVTTPRCGPHSKDVTIPLKVLITEILKYAKMQKEAKGILQQKQVRVNNIARKDFKFPVGIMDVIEIPATKEYFRILLDHKGRLMPHKITKEEATIRPSKIIGKRTIRNNKVQIQFFDGSTMVVDNKDYKIGDTILFDLQKKTVKSHFRFDKGAIIYIMGGKQAGKVGALEEVKHFKNVQPDNVIIKVKDGKLETRKSYAFVIGEKEPSISYPGE